MTRTPYSPKTDEYFRKAIVVRVKDGDTLVAMVDLGFSIFTKLTFRFYGINAPEKKTPEGKIAQAYMKKYLPSGSKLVLEVIRNPSGKLSRTFDRYVAIPYYKGINLCDHMVRKGYAKRWTKFKRFRKNDDIGS